MEMRDLRLRKLRASEVLQIIRPKLLEKFEVLKQKGIATEIYVFGSVAKYKDTRRSDIDLFVTVVDASKIDYFSIRKELCEWIMYPLHLLVDCDDAHGIPFPIYEEAIKLVDWQYREPKKAEEKKLSLKIKEKLDVFVLGRAFGEVMFHIDMLRGNISDFFPRDITFENYAQNSGLRDMIAMRLFMIGRAIKKIISQKNGHDQYGVQKAFPYMDWETVDMLCDIMRRDYPSTNPYSIYMAYLDFIPDLEAMINKIFLYSSDIKKYAMSIKMQINDEVWKREKELMDFVEAEKNDIFINIAPQQ